MLELKDVALVAGVGAVAALWSQIKGVLTYISTLLIVPMRLALVDENAQYTLAFFVTKLIRFRCSGGSLGFIRPFLRSKGRDAVVATENSGDTTALYFYHWAPLWVTAKNGRHQDPGGITLRYVRGTVNIDQLMIDIADYADALTAPGGARRFFVRTLSGYGHSAKSESKNDASAPTPPGVSDNTQWNTALGRATVRFIGTDVNDIGRRIASGDPLKYIALNLEMDEVIKDVEFWLAHRDWYRERSISWKYGVCFTGGPGTGKTLLARCIAEKFDMPIYLFDLASMSNADLRSNWGIAQHAAPCVVVFEDIDGCFDKRECLIKNDMDSSRALTFDGLLNVIDGVDKTDGILLIITTNKPEMLDEALAANGSDGNAVVSRPGRIDRCVKFQPLTEAGRLQIAKLILDEMPDLIWVTVTAGVGESGAQFTRRCVLLARQELWKRKRNGKEAAGRSGDREPRCSDTEPASDAATPGDRPVPRLSSI